MNTVTVIVIFLSTFFYSILTSQRTVCRLYNLFISHTESFRVGRGRRPGVVAALAWCRPGVVPPVAQTNKQFNHTSGYAVISRRRNHFRFHTGSSDEHQLQWCRDASHPKYIFTRKKKKNKSGRFWLLFWRNWLKPVSANRAAAHTISHSHTEADWPSRANKLWSTSCL